MCSHQHKAEVAIVSDNVNDENRWMWRPPWTWSWRQLPQQSGYGGGGGSEVALHLNKKQLQRKHIDYIKEDHLPRMKDNTRRNM